MEDASIVADLIERIQSMPLDSIQSIRTWYSAFHSSIPRSNSFSSVVYSALYERLLDDCRSVQIPALLKGFHHREHSFSSSMSSSSSGSIDSSASMHQEPIVAFAHKLRTFHDILSCYCEILAQCASVCTAAILSSGNDWFAVSSKFVEAVRARLVIDGADIVSEQLRVQVHENLSLFRKERQRCCPLEVRYQDQFEEETQEEELEEEDSGDENSYVHAPQEDLSLLDTSVFVRIVTDLELLDLCVAQVRLVIQDAVHRLVDSFCRDDLASSYERPLLLWTEMIAQPFVQQFHASLCPNLNDIQTMAYEELCSCRVQTIFEIVVDFPDSEPAVRDLAAALQRTGMYSQFSEALLRSVSTRLLQPGAKTSDIVNTYVSAVRIVSYLDASRTILKSLSDHVGTYLKQRPDAIRSIVLGMVEEDGDLYMDLVRFPSMQSQSSQKLEEDPDDLDWHPVPLEAGSTLPASDPVASPSAFGSVKSTPSPLDTPIDVIALLVSLLGNRDVVLNEYRSVLAQRLLAKNSFDIDAEIKVHELLKVRFGESALHTTDVMLKDISDSKRLNTQLQVPIAPDGAFRSLIVSACYWPSFASPAEADFVPHVSLKSYMDQFSQKYSTLKAPRRLEWKAHLGSVDVDIQLDSGESVSLTGLNLVVASLLLHLVDRSGSATLSDLAQLVRLSGETVSKRLGPLVSQRIVHIDLSSGLVQIASSLPSSDMDVPLSSTESADDDASQRQAEAEMAVFESYVLAMLENLGSMTLDRIHNMLKMYCFDPPYDKSPEQLSTFLNKLTLAEKLDRDGSSFQLHKA